MASSVVPARAVTSWRPTRPEGLSASGCPHFGLISSPACGRRADRGHV